MVLKLLRIVPSKKRLKKYDAVFDNDGKKKVVSFGGKYPDGRPYTDFIRSGGDLQRRERYIERHARNEEFTDPTRPSTLARYILWEKPTLEEAIAAFRRRFHV